MRSNSTFALMFSFYYLSIESNFSGALDYNSIFDLMFFFHLFTYLLEVIYAKRFMGITNLLQCFSFIYLFIHLLRVTSAELSAW